jgi:hypothetical protein
MTVETVQVQENLAGMELSDLPGVNVMLMGPAGTGKTHSIGTLAEAYPNLEVFYLGLEPGMETLLGYYKGKNKSIPPNLHWHYLEAAKASFKDLLDGAKRVNTMSLETLAKTNDPNRSKTDSSNSSKCSTISLTIEQDENSDVLTNGDQTEFLSSTEWQALREWLCHLSWEINQSKTSAIGESPKTRSKKLSTCGRMHASATLSLLLMSNGRKMKFSVASS